jgi:Glyoxalase/Bleomycin resistance protein/Dioxygenase superfamily
MISAPGVNFAVLSSSTPPTLPAENANDRISDGHRVRVQAKEEPMAMPMPAEWSFGATIPAKDLEGTRRFYEDILGVQVVMEDPGGILYRSGDSSFSLYPTEFAGTAQHTLGAFMVSDVEAAVADLRAKGVTFEDYDLPGSRRSTASPSWAGSRGPGSKALRATSCRWSRPRQSDPTLSTGRGRRLSRTP